MIAGVTVFMRAARLGDTVIDPTSDVGETTAETAPTCATCGDPIVNEPDHRVVTRIEDDEVRTAHFCDESCLAAEV